MTKWTAADIPDQTGRTAVITGPTPDLDSRPPQRLPPMVHTWCWLCATSTRASRRRHASPRPPRRRSRASGA